MIRVAALVLFLASFAGHAQQISFDTLYSRDSDDTRVAAQSLTAWRFAPAVVDTQLMSWYATSDIDVRNSGHGQLRLGFKTQEPAAAVAMLPRLDFRGAAIKLSVRAARWDDVTQFVLIFGSDGVSATQTLTLDVKRKLVNPPDGEWVDLVVPVAELERYNNIDPSGVDFAMIRAQGRTGSHVDVSTVSLVGSRDGAAHERRILDPQFDVAARTVRNAADKALQFNYGARATALDVRNDAGVSRHATDTRALGSVEFGRFSAAGSVGVLNAHSDTTVGSAEIAWRFADSLVMSLGHARNIVDTVEALQADVVQDATTLAADYSTARWGIYAGVADIDYTDGNDRSVLNTKLHVGIWDKIGASAYVRSLHYRNSDPYTGFYFSPEKYERWLAGVAIRTRLSRSVIIAGHVDAGRQTSDGDDSQSWTTRVVLESRATRNWHFKFTAGVDQTRPDYRYRYVMGYIAYE